jgi:hypothetical protein
MIRFTLLTVDTIHKTMKTKVAFLTFLAAATVSCAWAQSTEDDDMYFTSKDRVAFSVTQNASRQAVLASTNSSRITESEVASTINPTDTYSARNVNPEYVSGSKVGSNSTASVQYFSPNYQPTLVNQTLASNCNTCGYNNSTSYNGFNNGYGYNRFGSFGSPYGMGMSPYGYNSYGMMNPYSNYGGYGYSPYSMMGMGNGFYGSGMSFGFGSGFGNSFGCGSPFGFGNNYYGMNSYYGGYNSFYNPYGYGSSVIVVDNRNTSYGTRSSRSTGSPNYYNSNGQGVSNGRSVAASGTSSAYYDRGWRQSTNSTTRSTWDNPGNSGGNNRGWNNSNSGSSNWGGRQSSWGNNNNSFNNGGFSGGRSSSFGGGGGFSGGGGGSHSGGGGRGGRH